MADVDLGGVAGENGVDGIEAELAKLLAPAKPRTYVDSLCNLFRLHMSKPAEPKLEKLRISVRTVSGLIGAIAVGLLPIAYFGWRGILSAVVLILAGTFFVLGQRKFAIALFSLLLLGLYFIPALDGARGAILRVDLGCSPKTGPEDMRVFKAHEGKETRHDEEWPETA